MTRPQREHPGEDDAERRVLLHARRRGHGAGHEGAAHARREGAEDEGKPEEVGADDARQDRVGDGVAHERPALQHDEAGQQPQSVATTSPTARACTMKGWA
jgi:hypothetical protein